MIGAALPVFVFSGGPIWDHPFAIDPSVYWSYAPIPILAALLLLRRRAFTWLGFSSSTAMALTIKYLLTSTAAFALWAVSGDPPPPPPYVPEVRSSLPGRVPFPSELAAVSGSIRGVAPPGTWVYLRGAFDAYDHDAPIASVEITHDGRALIPPLTVLQQNEALLLRSLDGSLHTFRGVTPSGAFAFNLPIVPGATEPVLLSRHVGRVDLSCTVHANRREGALILVSHPFYARAGEDGSFEIDRIPAGWVDVVAVGDREESVAVDLVLPGEVTFLSL